MAESPLSMYNPHRSTLTIHCKEGILVRLSDQINLQDFVPFTHFYITCTRDLWYSHSGTGRPLLVTTLPDFNGVWWVLLRSLKHVSEKNIHWKFQSFRRQYNSAYVEYDIMFLAQHICGPLNSTNFVHTDEIHTENFPWCTKDHAILHKWQLFSSASCVCASDNLQRCYTGKTSKKSTPFNIVLPVKLNGANISWKFSSLKTNGHSHNHLVLTFTPIIIWHN